MHHVSPLLLLRPGYVLSMAVAEVRDKQKHTRPPEAQERTWSQLAPASTLCYWLKQVAWPNSNEEMGQHTPLAVRGRCRVHGEGMNKGRGKELRPMM